MSRARGLITGSGLESRTSGMYDFDDNIRIASISNKGTGGLRKVGMENRPVRTTGLSYPYSFAWSPDGLHLYISYSGDYIRHYTVNTPFTDDGISTQETFNCNSYDSNTIGMEISPDGRYLYFCGFDRDTTLQFTMTSAFDVASSANNTTFSPGYEQSNKRLDNIFSIGSSDGSIRGCEFNADGTKMFITGVQGNNVHEYALTTGFDVSTASFTQTLVTTVDTDNFGLDFKPDGTKMYIVGAGNDKIYEFNLSTGFDISTATFNQDFNVGNNNDSWASGDWEPFGIEWHPSGTRLFVVGTGGNEVNLYKLSTAWDISTVTYVERYHIGGNPSGLHFSYDGTKMFTVGNQSDLVRSYTLSIPYVFTEYVGGWSLSFDASETSTTKFTTNSNDNTRWVWNGVEWKNAIERIYPAGYWRLYL